MNTKLYLYIAIRVIILCVLGMFHTFIPEHLSGWFGDYVYQGNNEWIPNGTIIWGVRHHWYNAMMVILFALSVVDIIIKVINKVQKLS